MIVAGPPNKKKEKADNTHNKPSTNGLCKDKPQLVKIQVLPTQTHNVTTITRPQVSPQGRATFKTQNPLRASMCKRLNQGRGKPIVGNLIQSGWYQARATTQPTILMFLVCTPSEGQPQRENL